MFSTTSVFWSLANISRASISSISLFSASPYAHGALDLRPNGGAASGRLQAFRITRRVVPSSLSRVAIYRISGSIHRAAGHIFVYSIEEGRRLMPTLEESTSYIPSQRCLPRPSAIGRAPSSPFAINPLHLNNERYSIYTISVRFFNVCEE